MEIKKVLLIFKIMLIWQQNKNWEKDLFINV